MSEYSRLIQGLCAAYDMRSELDRRKAFRDCQRFAQENVPGDAFLEFLRQAAEQLGQLGQFEKLAALRDGKERLHLRFDEAEGVQLVGNRGGLNYLAQELRNLAQSDTPGEYLYFYGGEDPLDEYSMPLAIYLEDDAYFQTLEEDEVEEEVVQMSTAQGAGVQRALAPQDIAAFFLAHVPPQSLAVTPMQFYRVLSCEVCDAALRDRLPPGMNAERVVVVLFRRDDGGLMRMALSLDDPATGFVTFAQLNSFTP